MKVDTHMKQYRATVTLISAVAAALLVTGCSALGPTTPVEESTSSDGSITKPDETVAETEISEPAMPADFPEEILLPDGELVSASGGGGSWEIVKNIQLVDQVSTAVPRYEKSFGFTVNEFVDGEYPSWKLSNDNYSMFIVLESGNPILMSVVVNAL